jgi:hypothetical protein
MREKQKPLLLAKSTSETTGTGRNALGGPMTAPSPKSLRIEVDAETTGSPGQVIEIAGKDFSHPAQNGRP